MRHEEVARVVRHEGQARAGKRSGWTHVRMKACSDSSRPFLLIVWCSVEYFLNMSRLGFSLTFHSAPESDASSSEETRTKFGLLNMNARFFDTGNGILLGAKWSLESLTIAWCLIMVVCHTRPVARVDF